MIPKPNGVCAVLSDFPATDIPSPLECSLAECAIGLLRANGVTDAEILNHYTDSVPQADRAYERQVLIETGTIIASRRVKAHMRRLLTH